MAPLTVEDQLLIKT